MRKRYLCLPGFILCFFAANLSFAQCTLTCPDPITVGTGPGNSQCGTFVTFSIQNPCNLPVTCVTGDNTPVTSGAFFPVGTTTVICTSTAAQCSFTVTVNDNTPPNVSCPAPTSASADGNCQGAVPNVLAGVTVTDNCSSAASITLTQSPAAGTLVGVGQTTITVTATDAAGNQSTCTTTFTVNDVTAPQITCPADIFAIATNSQCSAVVNYTTPTATDACGGPVTVVASPASGSTFPLGTTTVTVTATDASNNTSQCTFHVTVGATLTCPDPITVVTGPGNSQCGTNVPFNVVSSCGLPITCVTGDNTPVSSGSFFPVGTTTVTCTSGGAQCSFTVTVNDNTPPNVSCPAPTSASADGNCQATVPNVLAGVTATDNCSSPGNITLTQSPAAGTLVGVGQTLITVTATDAAGNQSTCTTTFTVNDVTAPQITCPADIEVTPSPGQCSVVVNYTTPTATDACGPVTVVATPASGSSFSTGTTTVTVTATDASNNTAQCTFHVTVTALAPSITDLTATPSALWPPNHKMQTVALSYTLTNGCNCTPLITVTSNEPTNGTGDGDTSPDWMVVDAHHVQLRAERGNNKDQRVYTITVTCSDQYGHTAYASTNVTVAHNITGPITGTPFRVGSTVSFAGVFWDQPGNRHTANWTIDDNTTVKGIVTEPSGQKNGKVTGSYKFTSAGIYRMQMNVTDQKKITSYANTNEDQEEIIVIYDPNGGYSYGGGYFESPAGALTSDATATGKGNFGFTVNYFKGATLPKGETQFEFKVGSFQYNALNFDYLSISGYKAVFAGSGKIVGGPSGVNFTMYVVDGPLDGTGVDKVRLMIYNKNTGFVYYDNEPGKSDAADPQTAVGLNSTIVIGGSNNLVTSSGTVKESVTNLLPQQLLLQTYPNPSPGTFNLIITSTKLSEKVVVKVTDVLGRLVERREVSPNQTISIGSLYKPGVYIVQAVQGQLHQETKLNKISY